MTDKLTPEQIQNWRRVLSGMIGLYALLMPESQVQEFRDKLQAQANKPSGEWKCPACGTVQDGSTLNYDPRIESWTCSDAFCGATCYPVKPG